jgi:predicted permease
MTRRSDRDRDLAREMRAHLELEAAEREADGAPPAEARRAAHRAFGNAALVGEDARAVWTPLWAQQAAADARYAWRLARRAPWFTLGAVAIVALGIGASTAIFSALRGVVLAPLPFERPDELVRVSQTNLARGVADFSVSLPLYRDWQARSTSWRAMGATRTGSVTVLGLGTPQQLDARYVTASLLPVLGVRVALGRGITTDDDRVGAGLVAVISTGLWREAFGASPGAVGRTLMVDGRAHTIVGVAPAGVPLAGDADLLLPLVPFEEDRRNFSNLDVIARLAPGVTLARARAEMAALEATLAAESSDGDTGWGVRLVPVHDALLGPTTPRTLYLLVAAAAILLIVACANLSGLLLVRGSARGREMAIRAALGGGRGRIARQLGVESAWIAGLGGLAGVGLAAGGAALLQRTIMAELPGAARIGVDGWVLFFACAASALAAAIAGVAPILQVMRTDIERGLREGAPAAARGGHALRRVLIAGQLALAVVLLAGAGLTMRTLAHLTTIDLGFRPDRVLTLQVAPGASPETLVARLVDRLRRLPDIEAVGATSGAPMASTGNTSLNLYAVGPAAIPASEFVQADWRVVSDGYFAAMGIPLVAGRDISSRDTASSQKVIVVNQALARVMWGDADPIGRQVDLGGGGGVPAVVVGVVRDVRLHTPAIPAAPTYYVPLGRGLYSPATLVIRTRAAAERVVPLVRTELDALDPALPVFDVRTMAARLDAQLAPQRTLAGLLAAFAVAATVLGAIGLYGVVSYATAQRTREVALRLALGATRAQVIRPLVREGVLLIAVGTGVGVALVVPLGRAMESTLTDISPLDPFALSAAVLVLAAASWVACAIPAWRASRTNPAIVLRGA